MPTRRPEVEIARPVVAYLKSQQWDVHQEVAYRGCRADIVAASGPLLWIVEVKAALGMTVLDQARTWLRLGCAHFVSVATPPARETAKECARVLGIGVLSSMGEGICRPVLPPVFRRRITGTLAARLNDQTRTYAEAGNAANQFWSPYRETCTQLTQVVLDRPGITTRDLIGAIRHHYAADPTARSCLMQWARRGKIPGIVLDEHVRPARWYPRHRAPYYARQASLALG